jgi:hypothetical protein
MQSLEPPLKWERAALERDLLGYSWITLCTAGAVAWLGDAAAALRELRERVFREGDYQWWDEFGEFEPRPDSVEGIWAADGRWRSGTHSILDIDRVADTTDPPG